MRPPSSTAQQVRPTLALYGGACWKTYAFAKEYGILTPEGMAELRRGKSATITKGQYAGQEAEADHVIPRAVCPELQNQVMNLELHPASLNQAKSDKVTERAKVFAKELYDAKLLSEEGWERVSGISSK